MADDENVGGKLLGGIKIMYVNSRTCVIVKGSERKYFKTESGVRQGCIMSPWLFNVYTDAMIKKNGNEDEEGGSEVSGGRESGDGLFSCMQMTWFCVVIRMRT